MLAVVGRPTVRPGGTDLTGAGEGPGSPGTGWSSNSSGAASRVEASRSATATTDSGDSGRSRDAKRPRVTERPKPPELLGATFAATRPHPRRAVSDDPATSTGPVCPFGHLDPSPDHYSGHLLPHRSCDSTSGPALRPVLRSPPDFGGTSASRTIDTMIGGPNRVKRPARNPYLFLNISCSVPRNPGDVHCSSPARRETTSLSVRCTGVGGRGMFIICTTCSGHLPHRHQWPDPRPRSRPTWRRRRTYR